MACRGGMQDAETPPDLREENGILLHLFRDKASLRSQSFPGNTFPSLGCQVFTFPLGSGGRRVKLRPSVSQIQANALLQQFEANVAVGFPG